LAILLLANDLIGLLDPQKKIDSQLKEDREPGRVDTCSKKKRSTRFTAVKLEGKATLIEEQKKNLEEERREEALLGTAGKKEVSGLLWSVIKRCKATSERGSMSSN